MSREGKEWMGELAEQLSEQIAAAVRQAVDNSELNKLIKKLSESVDRVAAPEDDEAAPATKDPVAAARTDKRICSEPGCSEPARARGLCSKHYQRLRYAEKRAAEEGLPPPASLEEAAAKGARKAARKTSKRGGGPCSVEGCDRPNYAKGMCGKHFMEWVRSRKQ